MSRSGPPPARWLPVLYFGVAHLLLVAAFAAIAVDPGRIAGFYYQPRTIGIVHMVTIGWISATILGALYVLGPLALRTPMPVRASDSIAFGLFVIGALGMTAHFLIEEYSGVAWSGGMALLGALVVGVRAGAAVRAASVQSAVKLHLFLAFLNLAVAGSLGLLQAAHKARPFLSGPPLPRVFAHLHLAAIGWAVMMAVGIGYRMLPMVLPSVMPEGRSLYASAILLEAGVLGQSLSWLTTGHGTWLAACAAVAGLAVFLFKVRWMRERRRPRPRWLRLPDYGLLHTLQSFLYAALACAIGVWLSAAPERGETPRLEAAYGVIGIVGFLAQMVLGMQIRIVPMFSALQANRRTACAAPPKTPFEMGSQAARGLVLVLWTAGVPLLAAGMYLSSAFAVGAGGWLLLFAAVVNAIQTAAILRHAL